eukprot:10657091-Heterocapsa_arctica.AAC.1
MASAGSSGGPSGSSRSGDRDLKDIIELKRSVAAIAKVVEQCAAAHQQQEDSLRLVVADSVKRATAAPQF